MRRFAEIDEIFTERFATNLSKHFDHYINEKITKLIKCFDFYMKCFNYYINYQIDEKTTKSKIANINYY